jgi:hypothetical protein
MSTSPPPHSQILGLVTFSKDLSALFTLCVTGFTYFLISWQGTSVGLLTKLNSSNKFSADFNRKLNQDWLSSSRYEALWLKERDPCPTCSLRFHVMALVVGIFFFFLNCSIALVGPGLFQFPDLFTIGRAPWTSDQLVAKSLPKHRTAQHKINTYTHQTSMP